MVDESALTGENHPVAKTGEGLPTVASSPSLTQQRNIVFAGTLVNAGRGRVMVVACGERTEFGKIASELSTVESRKSPLQVKIDELGQKLATLSTAAIVVIGVIGYLMGRPFLETVTVAVSLAVAAIPEGLPICVTVTLALGVLRMARMNAIVKKLPVVESLGCATVIASDKTGTLTQNEMTARSVYTLAYPEASFGFTGVGYDGKNGELVQTSTESRGAAPSSPRRVDESDNEFVALSALFHTACLCNNATLSDDSHHSGQPTELAMLVAAVKSKASDPRPLYHRIQEIPFTSDRKRMEVRARPVNGQHSCSAFTVAQKQASSLTKMFGGRRGSTESQGSSSGNDGSLYFVKGMPEAVLGECTSFMTADGSSSPLTEDGKADVLSHSRRMAASGLRVLAMAFGSSLEALTFAGIIGMEDPVRVGVADAVRQLRRGGIKVLMVTGDSKETALAIARRCGILGSDYDDGPAEGGGLMDNFHSSQNFADVEFGASFAMSGEELDTLSPQNLSDSIVGIRVFYRVAPKHKLALVRALQKQDEIVAVTGDGVNDALSLKGADIGISMGRCGTDVAKEASDIVLADDDFSTITRAVAEGKGIFFNIRNFLAFQLSTSFAALTMASVATALGMPSPLNAMQILWINIIMDGPPAQSLGVEPVDEKILRAKPRKADDPIITRALLTRCITSAALIVFLTLKVFANELRDGTVNRRDTTMTFMMFVNCDLLNAYCCRSSEKAFYELNLFSNPAFLWAVGGSIIGQLLVIYFAPLQEVFQTEALSGSDMLYIVFLSSSMLWMDTLRKKFFANWCSDAYKASPRAKKDEDGKMIKVRSWLNFRQLDRSTNKRHQARNRNMLAL